MELLILLAASDGHLVTRTEIAERLWDREVFVDTEHGINTAIRKIRIVLRDDPEQPRFVQTVSGKGYRFVSTVEVLKQPSEPASEKESAPGLEFPNAYPGDGLATNPANMAGEVTEQRNPIGFRRRDLVSGSGSPNRCYRCCSSVDLQAPARNRRSGHWLYFRSTIFPAIPVRITSPTA